MIRMLPAVALAALLAAAATAADWPQWQGPDRNNISKEMMAPWPKEGPKLLWTYREAGVGYSSPSIVGGMLYSLGAEEQGGKDTEFVFALDTATGKEKWRKTFGKPHDLSGSDRNWGGGPRGTPSLVDGKLYAEGNRGDVVCLNAQDGTIIWEKSLADLGGKMMSGWGNSESVLVDGTTVICTPGGKNGTLAALQARTGEVIWQSAGLTDDAAYSSPVAADIGGVKQYVQQSNKGVFGVAAADGKLLWHVEVPGYRTAVISGYGAGCTLVEIKKDGDSFKTDVKYKANKNMTNHHGGVVLVGDYIYGYSDGRGWVCQNLKTGENKWEEKKGVNQGGLDKGSLTCVGGDLVLYGEGSGNCVRVTASPDGWKELGRFKIPEETKKRKPSGKFWTHPVVANGKLYLRDQDLLFCFAVGQ
jgi:outer membrane protein assembly factor BamB